MTDPENHLLHPGDSGRDEIAGADEAFAHGCLRSLVETERGQIAPRIARVLTALGAGRPAARRLVISPFRLAAAAVFILALTLGISVVLSGESALPPAMAVVGRAVRAFDDVDRRYAVRFAGSEAGSPAVAGTLIVRGTRFHTRLESPLGPLRAGFDGESAWFEFPPGRIHRGTIPESAVRSLGLDEELLNIRSAVDRMTRHFDIAVLGRERIEDGATRPLIHLRGTPAPDRSPVPARQVDIWADETTGVIHRAIIDLPRARQIRFEYLGVLDAGPDAYRP